jgi:hypothetical protein
MNLFLSRCKLHDIQIRSFTSNCFNFCYIQISLVLEQLGSKRLAAVNADLHRCFFLMRALFTQFNEMPRTFFTNISNLMALWFPPSSSFSLYASDRLSLLLGQILRHTAPI